MSTSASRYHRHRFPTEIIGHCVWLYFRFTLSFRDVEEMLAMRGGAITYETVREWCRKFGQTYANDLRRYCQLNLIKEQNYQVIPDESGSRHVVD